MLAIVVISTIVIVSMKGFGGKQREADANECVKKENHSENFCAWNLREGW